MPLEPDAAAGQATRRSRCASVPSGRTEAALFVAVISSSKTPSTIAADGGQLPFSDRTYRSAAPRSTKRPPRAPLWSRTTQFPRRSRPITKIGDSGHNGGSDPCTSIIAVFLRSTLTESIGPEEHDRRLLMESADRRHSSMPACIDRGTVPARSPGDSGVRPRQRAQLAQ
jgi:hypothetical protein